MVSVACFCPRAIGKVQGGAITLTCRTSDREGKEAATVATTWLPTSESCAACLRFTSLLQLASLQTSPHMQMCKHWVRLGSCLFGDTCSYRHPEHCRGVNTK